VSPSPEGLDLLFLGSGNAFSEGRYWSSFLVNGRYLFDCSPIAVPHLKQCGIALEDIEVIFISHFHGDHYFGLPFLFLEFAEKTHREKDLTIVGPPGVMERTMKVTEAGYANVFRKKDRGYSLSFQEVVDDTSAEIAGMRFVARRVEHVPDLQSFGYRAEIDGRTIAYSGDSMLCDALVDLGRGADVFVVECSKWEGPGGVHIDPDGLRELRQRLGPAPKFVLTHLGHGEQDLGIENCVLASDLGRLSL
jgi:ribonuclease BN (tRNA processing enzyme)